MNDAPPHSYEGDGGERGVYLNHSPASPTLRKSSPRIPSPSVKLVPDSRRMHSPFNDLLQDRPVATNLKEDDCDDDVGGGAKVVAPLQKGARRDDDPSNDLHGRHTNLGATHQQEEEIATVASKEDSVYNSKLSFPLRLTRMLESVERMRLSHIIHWSDHENSFVICDVDLFLTEVLPKFYASSENTKIRSFYRKLNRWGFSMSRKSVNNRTNVWHRPDFNRTSAVRALNQALETGKATNFLNMASVSRGKRRRGVDANSKNGEHHQEDDDTVFSFNRIGSETSILTVGDPGLQSSFPTPSRSVTRMNVMGGNMGGTASMPILPSAKLPSVAQKGKRWKKLSNSFTSGADSFQRNHGQLMQMLTAKARRVTQLAHAPNDSFAGSSNATFDTIVEGTSNARLGLSLFSTSHTPGLLSTSSGIGPSPNIFELSAQDIFAAHGTACHSLTNSCPNMLSNGNSPKSCQILTCGRSHLHQEMTEEEDKELASFFGTFAKQLPASQGCEEHDKLDAEPDPFPPWAPKGWKEHDKNVGEPDPFPP